MIEDFVIALLILGVQYHILAKLVGPKDMVDASDASSGFKIPTSDEELENDDNLQLPTEPSDPEMFQQKTHFMQIEEWSRVLNAEMTPLERKDLLALELPGRLEQDVKKVVNNFGKYQGAGAPCRRVLQYLVQKHHPVLRYGDKVEVTSPMFSLLKHLVIADRNTQHLPETNACIGCSCFAETYLMPHGCRHKQVKLFKDIYQPHTLCQECSYCWRCHRLLGQYPISYYPISYYQPVSNQLLSVSNQPVSSIQELAFVLTLLWSNNKGNLYWFMLRLCKVAAVRTLGRANYKEKLLAGDLCRCHSQSGILGHWRHYQQDET